MVHQPTTVNSCTHLFMLIFMSQDPIKISKTSSVVWLTPLHLCGASRDSSLGQTKPSVAGGSRKLFSEDQSVYQLHRIQLEFSQIQDRVLFQIVTTATNDAFNNINFRHKYYSFIQISEGWRICLLQQSSAVCRTCSWWRSSHSNLNFDWLFLG